MHAAWAPVSSSCGHARVPLRWSASRILLGPERCPFPQILFARFVIVLLNVGGGCPANSGDACVLAASVVILQTFPGFLRVLKGGP